MVLFLISVSAISRDKRATPTGQIVTATVRSKVTLICDVDETVFNLVEWRRNDTSDDIFIQYQDYRPSVHVSYINRVTLKDGKNLQIASLNLGDEDTYFCKVVNTKTGTTSQSPPIKLLVLGMFFIYISRQVICIKFSFQFDNQHMKINFHMLI